MDEYDLEPTRVYDEDLTRIHRPPPIHDESPEQETLPCESSSLGRYTLQRSLGVGGFAEVYLAEDDTGHLVALKQLLPGVASSSEIVRRFRSVAERSQALKHPNIITVHGYEVVGERPAIVMEYVQGQSLRQTLSKRGILPVDEALDVALQLCDALIYAHNNGFIHRDVKPANVLITPEGTVKLGDFDIAKIITSSAMTQVGLRLGTPYYMSPEQIRGQPDVDGRSDVFSMGVVLYEMLTGEVPVGHLGHPSELNPNLPRRLGSVILKALARDRGARYASIQDLRDALTGSPEALRTQERPFYFRGRPPAQTIGELIELCEGSWESARWHLTEGHFSRWLQVVDSKLAQEAETSLSEEEDSDLALEKLLHLLDPTLPPPVLAVSPEFEIDVGEMAAQEKRSHKLKVSNPSRGYLVGAASLDQAWLEVSPIEFRLKEGEDLLLIVVAEAPGSLGKHSGRITLGSNGGTVNLPIHLRTALRLLFPQAGQSAGSVAELIELCNTYRAEAIELFCSGAVERWLEEGLMRFDLVARAQELSMRYGGSTDRKEQEKGLRAFLLACDPDKQPAQHEPFIFRNGERAGTIPALVELCEKHWTDAQWHLYEGHFTTWLEVVEPVLVAEVEHVRETEEDRDLGLEGFLHILDPELPSPQLEVNPQETDLGSAAPREKKQFSVTIRNGGRGYLKGRLMVPDALWVRLESSEDSFGLRTDGSCQFHFVAEVPAGIGDYWLLISIQSNGGEMNLPVRVQVARRLLFPQGDLSVGSIEELAEVSSKCWGEGRALWEDGKVQEWLHRGLMRFDLVDLADQISTATHFSLDLQLIQFLLQACSDCQQWLPPCLQISQDSVDLGTALHQTAPYHLLVHNIGGGDLEGLSVVRSPSWLDTRTLVEEPSGTTLELRGDTRNLRNSGLFEEDLIVEWAGTFGGAELAPQRLAISVKMRIANSLRIGRWRIPFGGHAQVGSKTVSVGTLWVAGIGLASLVFGIAVGSWLKSTVWGLLTWLALWLEGGIAWALFGVGYHISSLPQDVLDWLKDLPGNVGWVMQNMLEWVRRRQKR